MKSELPIVHTGDVFFPVCFDKFDLSDICAYLIADVPAIAMIYTVCCDWINLVSSQVLHNADLVLAWHM